MIKLISQIGKTFSKHIQAWTYVKAKLQATKREPTTPVIIWSMTLLSVSVKVLQHRSSKLIRNHQRYIAFNLTNRQSSRFWQRKRSKVSLLSEGVSVEENFTKTEVSISWGKELINTTREQQKSEIHASDAYPMKITETKRKCKRRTCLNEFHHLKVNRSDS